MHSGDSVLLSLTFSGSNVQMLAQDWSTGAAARTSYTSVGSSSFVGNPSHPSSSLGFFTGLMTEWYHVLPYSGNEGRVTYTNQAVALSSGWMWIDEFNSGSSDSVFSNQTQSPVTFANGQQLYPFASNGATIYGSAHQFITGLLSTASSRVALAPAVPEVASPSFAATYTLAGLRQSAEMAAGTGNLVEADPGTSVTISINSSSSSSLERWVFSGTNGTAVTFAAGSNSTYFFYHLVQETISYQVAGVAPLPASSSPELVYEEPPASPSSTPAHVDATQPLGTGPVEVFAILGSNASLKGTIVGAVGERWAAIAQNWTLSAPNSIPIPIKFFQQYEVSVAYSIMGGGVPPIPPEFLSTSLGSQAVVRLSSNGTTGWVDAGSGYSFTSVLNGSTPTERWLDSGNASAPSMISSPGQALSEVYTHQYYANLGVNDPRGGTVSLGSGWLEAGSSLHLSATSNSRWEFETFNGTGGGAYTGTNPAIDVNVTGPLSEEATFYAQLAIAADAGTNIAYSYGSEAGSVQAGATKTIYVPPSSIVTLSASPSIFVYSFGSWQGTGFANTTGPLLVLVVDSPGAVATTSSYNYPAILAGGAAVAFVILASSLWIRSRRRREGLGESSPAAG